MKKYSRVSYRVRCQISVLLQAKISIPKIATQLGFNKSTIYREIKRNSSKESKKVYAAIIYEPIAADNKYKSRYFRCRRKLLVQAELENLVISRLKSFWSPEQISGRLRREGISNISYQSIYNFIKRHSHFKKYLLYQGLRNYRYRRHPSKRGRSSWMKSIHDRPQAANKRLEIGHWERDLMYAKKDPVLVCTDRKSRYTKMTLIERADITSVHSGTTRLLYDENVLTITNDNGPEFLSPTPESYPVYYCDPYRPQQRGTVENSIGVIRRFIKKKTSTTIDELINIEIWMNTRPRKVLDYKMPYEVFYNTKVALEC